MKVLHPDLRPTRPRAGALRPAWLAAAAWALAPLLLASCGDPLSADCPPLAHPPVLTLSNGPLAPLYWKRFDRALVSFLTGPEIDALLASPNRSTRRR